MIILTVIYDTGNGISSNCFACENIYSAIDQAKKLQMEFCDEFEIDTTRYHDCWDDDSYDDLYREITPEMADDEDHLVAESDCETERMYIRFKNINDLI